MIYDRIKSYKSDKCSFLILKNTNVRTALKCRYSQTEFCLDRTGPENTLEMITEDP